MSDAATEKADDTPDTKPLEDSQFVTSHSITIGGEAIAYTAKTGRIVLHDDEEQAEPKVAIFYTAYLRDDVERPRDRPLVFLWNGGPGSSAVWLHMYSVGPRRVVFERDPLCDTSRWELEENEHSILDVADLVFIDPPSTGFSRVAPGVDATEFHGVDPDAKAVGDFVREFVTRERRNESPIVLLGESYGTLRTPAVADYLQGMPGLWVNGIALVSSLMDTAGASFALGVANGAVGMLPSYAATALFHDVISGDLTTLLADAEDFALNELPVALLKGARLTEGERERTAKRMGELTGLSPEFLLLSNLKVNIWRYMKELLRDRRRTVGRLDTRWTGIDAEVIGEAFEDDPSMSRVWSPATQAFNRYVREDLGWDGPADLSYRTMTIFPKWRPRENQQMGIWTPPLETATQLRSAMNRDPQLKVLLQSGVYDLGTPYFTAELTFDHLHLDPERAANVTMTRFEAGHMFYIHEPSLAAMKASLVDFITGVRA